MEQIFQISALTLLTSVVLFPLMIKMSHRFKLLDNPDPASRGELNRPKKNHEVPLPRTGGVVMVLCSCLSYCFFFNQDFLYYYLCAASLFLVGFVDDLRATRAIVRLLLQLLITFALLYAIDFDPVSTSAFGHKIHLNQFVSYVVYGVAILGAINSFNMIDGVDGLAAGLALISVFTLTFVFFLATQNSDLFMFYSLPIACGIIGFLIFNSHPAKIFMGDGGSYWLGAAIGILILINLNPSSILIESRRSTTIPFVSIISCVAVPFFDSVGVVFGRLVEKRSPFSPDHNHLHHLFKKLGLGHKRLVLLIYFMGLGVAIAGALPLAYPKYELEFISWIVFLGIGTFILALKFKVVSNLFIDSFNRLSKIEGVPLKAGVAKIARIWAAINRYILYLILGISPFLVGQVPADIGLTSFALIPLLVMAMFNPNFQNGILSCIVLSVVGCVILVALNSNVLSIELNGQRYNLQKYYNNAYIVVFCSVLGYSLLTLREHYHKVSPTDFLLLMFPMILLLVPDPLQSEYKLGIISARTLVLFMAFRVLIFQKTVYIKRISFLLLIVLFYLGMNGYFRMKFIF